MAEKISYDASGAGRLPLDRSEIPTGRLSDKGVYGPETISYADLLACLGARAISFDSYRVVYAQESTWVLDMRLVANSAESCIDLRNHVRTVARAYFRHRRIPDGRNLQFLSWGAATFI